MASYVLLEQARHVEALVLDVDGILSDGFVTLTNSGDEIKSFDIRDGLGMKLVQQAGIKVIIITGRKSNIVEKRMTDLGVDLVYQGREDKGAALREACAQFNILPEKVKIFTCNIFTVKILTFSSMYALNNYTLSLFLYSLIVTPTCFLKQILK